METVSNIKLWNENVAAVAWYKEKEYATIEFYTDFAKNNRDMAEKQNIKNGKGIIAQIFDIVSQWTKYAAKYKVKTEFINIIQDNLILKL